MLTEILICLTCVYMIIFIINVSVKSRQVTYTIIVKNFKLKKFSGSFIYLNAPA